MTPRLESAIRALSTHSRVPVAPHVAARLDAFTRGDAGSLRELSTALSPQQLAGESLLPAVLPTQSSANSHIDLADLRTVERRLLLLAAVSVVDLVGVLLEAAAVDVSVLIEDRVRALLAVSGGKFAFHDGRVRSTLIEQASPSELSDAHSALARALRSLGSPHAAIWHTAASSASELKRLGPSLSEIADQQFLFGNLEAAQRIAQVSAQWSTGSARVRALHIASKAAVWSGRLSDADDLVAAMLKLDDPATSRNMLALIDTLRRGAESPQDSDPRRSITEVVKPLAQNAATAADRVTLKAVLAIFEQWYVDPDEADAIQARVMMSSIPSHSGHVWATVPGALSPIVEAHVCVMQVAFQLQVDELADASTTLNDGIHRLPLAYAGSGVVSSFVRIIAERQPGLSASLEAVFDGIGPANIVSYEVSGARVGQRSVDAARFRYGEIGDGLDPGRMIWITPPSPRELQVAELIGLGITNRAIAERLEISERTVEVHLNRIYKKAGVNSRHALATGLLRGRWGRQGDPREGRAPHADY